MRTKSDLYKFQGKAVEHIIASNGSMLWLDVGLGKTIVSLTAIEELQDRYEVRSVLVIAPVKVIEAVWAQEGAEWQHTQRLTFSLVRGNPAQRLDALRQPADIYLINYEQLKWLSDTLNEHWLDNDQPLPFDMVVFDEISKMKTATAKRCKAFVKLLPYFHYRVGLTGTPASNGVIDLHGQFLMVDGGHRLGPNITGYRTRWFIYNEYSRKYSPRRNAKEEIQHRIADITLEMSSDDYLELPPLVTIDHRAELPELAMDKYVEFENEFFATVDGEEIEAFNAGAKSIKCRQLANGAVYSSEDRSEWAILHEEKMDALGELVEELQEQPLLVCYQFIHDKERIRKRFPGAVFLDRTNVAEKVKDWNDGGIKLLIGHPASMGHGLNLQYGGCHLCWFGLPWSLELYEQAIGRLLRNGQTQTVFNHRLLAAGTIEAEVMAKVVEQKGATQRDLREAIKQYREQKL